MLDSNVIISGLTHRGRPREVLDLLIEGDIVVIISPLILQEVRESLSEDFGLGEREIQGLLAPIQSRAVVIEPKEEATATIDEADNRVLDCAVQGHAQYLVTGDKHHLQPLQEYQGIRIISPADFLQAIR